MLKIVYRTIALVISLVFATLLLICLVEQIEAVVHSGVPDQFLGLILLPLVEKAAEHLTAIDEAYDGVINVALYHCLGPSIQTALFNGPLVVIVGWILNKPMDLNFEIFMIVLGACFRIIRIFSMKFHAFRLLSRKSLSSET